MAKPGSAGDRIVVVVQKQRPLGSELSGSAAAAQKVRRGDISHAVVVRTKKKYGRPDGSFVRFDDNACVLINKAGDPMGTRLNGILEVAIAVVPDYGLTHVCRGCCSRATGKAVVKDPVISTRARVEIEVYFISMSLAIICGLTQDRVQDY
jgi:ribosomal protein L14